MSPRDARRDQWIRIAEHELVVLAMVLLVVVLLFLLT